MGRPRDYRSNSSVSDSGVLRRAQAVEAAARDVLLHKSRHLEVQHHAMGQQQARRASAVSVGPVMVHQRQQQQQQRRPSVNCGVQSTSSPLRHHHLQQSSFLLRERGGGGEEVVVTMRPVGPPVQGARAVVARIPSYQSTISPSPPQITVGGGGRDLPQQLPGKKRRSLDDGDVDYDSLLPPSELVRRFSELGGVGDEVLAANRLQKAYARFRRRARAASEDDFALALDEAESEHGRLSEWVRRDREERRRSCAVGEFASQAAARARTPVLLSKEGGRIRAHSSVGLAMPPGGLELRDGRRLCSSSYNIEHRRGAGGGNGSGHRRHSHLPKQQSSGGGSGGGLTVQGHLARRRSNCGDVRSTTREQQQQDLLHLEHARRNGSGRGRPHDPASDLEAAAQRLLHEVAPGHPGIVVNDLSGEKAPPEKERRRMVLAVSCVALAITVFAALLVGLTLGLSHMLEDLTPGRTTEEGRERRNLP